MLLLLLLLLLLLVFGLIRGCTPLLIWHGFILGRCLQHRNLQHPGTEAISKVRLAGA